MRLRNLADQNKETLNPRVRQWILIMLVPLGGMHSYSYNEVVNDALLQALFNFDDPEIELCKAELHAMLRKEYRRHGSQQFPGQGRPAPDRIGRGPAHRPQAGPART